MNIAIIGSGIVGLSLAYDLSDKINKVIVYEKEKDSLSHGTGRNSGVIHSGIYYKPNSLRSKLCIEGSKLMKNFILENNLYLKNCGKLLLPKKKTDLKTLDTLYQRSKKVGIDVRKLNSKDEILKIEPNCNPIFDQALFIKDTSLGDPEEVSKKLIEILKKRNVDILYSHKINEIFPQDGKLIVNNDSFKFDIIINAAGLRADEIAKKSSLKTNYSSLPFKGKYWRVKFNKTKYIPKTLLYPIPNLEYPFLGIHTVYDKKGNFYLGPSNTPVFGRESYNFFHKFNVFEFLNLIYKFLKKIVLNENNLRNLALLEFKNLFLHHVKKTSKVYFNLNNNFSLEISPKVGIRSQIFDNKNKSLFDDFVLIKQDKVIHILNAISPAWTSSFAMAKYISKKYKLKNI
tara:strand:+ start:2070 stop:3272 length:1203 start_codon:yes stop_codon:yes gene_type:complete